MYTVILNEMKCIEESDYYFSVTDFADGADFFNQIKINSW